MSTNSKNCPPAPKKLTREKPITPPPPSVPVFAKIPCPRDQRAYGLHLEQRSQRWIAGKLKCTQPTVLRGIRRMEKWLATTLPEDRGEYTATEKLRLALAKHERLMERLLKMSLREFRRSRKTIPMKKTITMKDGVDDQGKPVKIRIEEWNKPQIGRKGFIDAAAKVSHETTVLAAGYLGQGNGSISMAEVMDPEERDRWDRMVTSRDAQIKKLEESRRVHAAERNARVSDECSVVNQPPSNAVLACISQSLMHPTPPRGESAAARPAPVSKGAEKEPVVNQETDLQVVATSDEPTACATPPEDIPSRTADSQTCITVPPRMDTEPLLGAGHSAGGEKGDLRLGIAAGSEARAEPRVLDESRTAQTTPLLNQKTTDSEVASSIQKAPSGDRPESPPPVSQSLNQVNQEPRIPCSQVELGNEGTGIKRSATSGGRESLAAKMKEEGESGTLKTPDPGPPAPKYRWEDSFRQEALDFHCLKFGLPPATTDMATGIPDPFKMSPRLWIERGFPYMIHIDRTIPCHRKNPLDALCAVNLARSAVVNPEGW